jgi:hypothetical protein
MNRYEKSMLLTGVLGSWGIAAWITHVVVCIKATSWGFLIAGAIAFPVAWVHGTGIWFNLW